MYSKIAARGKDVWASSASLYFMLTGHTPREFPPNKDPWRIVLETVAAPIRQHDPAIPEKLADAIDRASIDQPTLHFKSANAFSRALQARYEENAVTSKFAGS